MALVWRDDLHAAQGVKKAAEAAGLVVGKDLGQLALGKAGPGDDPEGVEQLVGELRVDLQADLMAQFEGHLRRDYPIEIEKLDTALAHYAAEFPIDPMFIHVAFEVLTSRRFLQLPETHDARAVKGELLLLQDQSGCWRPGTGNDTIHATREAVHALGRFQRELRKLEPLPPSALR